MLRQPYRVPTPAIPIVYGALGEQETGTEDVPFSRVVAHFHAQLKGSQGVERVMVARRIRMMIRKAPPWVQQKVCGAIGLAGDEGADWRERYPNPDEAE